MSRLAILLLIGLFGLSACNTIGGFGEDVSATGDAVTDASDDVKENLSD